MNKRTIGFIGLGLIGGSIAKALRAKHPDDTFIAYNRSKTSLIEAMADGTINLATDAISSGFSECDIIFLCAPRQCQYPLSGSIKTADKTNLYSDRCRQRKNNHSRCCPADWPDQSFYWRTPDGRL